MLTCTGHLGTGRAPDSTGRAAVCHTDRAGTVSCRDRLDAAVDNKDPSAVEAAACRLHREEGGSKGRVGTAGGNTDRWGGEGVYSSHSKDHVELAAACRGLRGRAWGRVAEPWGPRVSGEGNGGGSPEALQPEAPSAAVAQVSPETTSNSLESTVMLHSR